MKRRKIVKMRGVFPKAARILVLALPLLAAAGCVGKVITVDLKKYPGPVMIGPAMRIGDEARPAPAGPVFSSFAGEQSRGIVVGRNQYVQGDYLITETRTTVFNVNDIGFKLQLAALFRTDLVAVVDELEAGSWIHVSFAWLSDDWIKMRGRFYDPKTIEWRKQK